MMKMKVVYMSDGKRSMSCLVLCFTPRTFFFSNSCFFPAKVFTWALFLVSLFLYHELVMDIDDEILFQQNYRHDDSLLAVSRSSTTTSSFCISLWSSFTISSRSRLETHGRSQGSCSWTVGSSCPSHVPLIQSTSSSSFISIWGILSSCWRSRKSFFDDKLCLKLRRTFQPNTLSFVSRLCNKCSFNHCDFLWKERSRGRKEKGLVVRAKRRPAWKEKESSCEEWGGGSPATERERERGW